MESALLTSSSIPCLQRKAIWYSSSKVQIASHACIGHPFDFNLQERGHKHCLVSSALPETAASIVVAAVAVGTAATILARRTKASEALEQSPMKICEDCGGSGICAQCKGEGFILKKLSEESADRARLTAKNMATRYTAGLPKKWSYCTKCSASRSCRICDGTGRIR